MSRYIRVVDGVPTGDTCTTDPARIFPADIAAQYVLSSEVPAIEPAQPTPNLEALRAQRLAAARAAVDAAANALVADVSATEQQTWPTQLAEAQALDAWRNAPALPPNIAPLLTVMAAARGYGESVFDLADKVLAAAARYTAAAGPLVAWGQRTERELIAANDAEALMSVSITPPTL